MPETKIKKLPPSYGKSRSVNIITRDLFIEKEVRENMEAAIKKMRYITPTELSAKFGIRISTAKEFLKELEKKKVIKRYDTVSNNRLIVYVHAD